MKLNLKIILGLLFSFSSDRLFSQEEIPQSDPHLKNFQAFLESVLRTGNKALKDRLILDCLKNCPAEVLRDPEKPTARISTLLHELTSQTATDEAVEILINRNSEYKWSADQLDKIYGEILVFAQTYLFEDASFSFEDALKLMPEYLDFPFLNQDPYYRTKFNEVSKETLKVKDIKGVVFDTYYKTKAIALLRTVKQSFCDYRAAELSSILQSAIEARENQFERINTLYRWVAFKDQKAFEYKYYSYDFREFYPEDLRKVFHARNPQSPMAAMRRHIHSSDWISLENEAHLAAEAKSLVEAIENSARLCNAKDEIVVEPLIRDRLTYLLNVVEVFHESNRPCIADYRRRFLGSSAIRILSFKDG